MKYVALALAASVLAVAPAGAQSGADNPTVTHDNPSSCLGAERASRNSAGGDREKGAFGQAQSDYVQSLNEAGEMSYGEFLQTWMQACANAPGGDEEDL